MTKTGFIISFFVMILVMLSCSFVKEKLLEIKDEIDKEETTNEKTNRITTTKDIIFYNKYIEVSKNISSPVDLIQDGYLSSVPDPKTVSKYSFVLLIVPQVQLGFLETTIKNYKRSYYDDGELSKLEADNSDMKAEVEKNFERLIPAVEDYMKTARKVINFYTDREYKNNLSKAVTYDNKIKQKYEEYEFAFDVFTETINKYKPERVIKDPDDYSDPDEKVIVIIQNALESTIEKAESFNENLKVIKKETEVGSLIKELREFEETFEIEKQKVLSAEYSVLTKFMKYSFEDYFSKTVTDFIKHTDKFLGIMQAGNISNAEFKVGYDNVILYYNLMITSYNSTLTTLNTFQTYK
jgi:hypothetical protein